MYSNGDARSAIAQHARDPSSMPPDHASSALWERQAFTRDKFERSERDKYASAKKDWALDNRPSSTRSSNTLFSNAGYAGPPAKRRALGRHGPMHENGRYGSAAGRPSDLVTHLWSPSENGKAERDFCGGPSPGYSSSPSTEKPSKDSDGHHFRDSNLSPSETRPASSPRFDPPSRLYGNQNTLDGTALRERERSKFSSSPYAWEKSHRERDYRERAWGRPDYHRRTYSLPKLDSPRDWSGGDRELLEGRIDRYGSASSREPAFSDVLNIASKEHHRYDWRNRDRSLFRGFASRSSACAPSSNSHSMDNGTASACLEVPRASSPPKPSATQGFVSHEPHCEDAGVASPKKRPRLTWGQGLAKYEKEKVEDEPSAIKKSEDSHHEMEEPCEGVHALSPEHNQPLHNGNISPGQNNCFEHEEQALNSGGNQGMQVERCSKFAQDLVAVCPNLGTVVQEVLGDEHLEDSTMGVGSPQSPSVEDATFVPAASQPSVLHDVQVFLESVLRERPILSKDVFTHHVEKVELEIERFEKELMKLDTELGSHEPVLRQEDEGFFKEQTGSTHDENFLAIQAHGSVSQDTPPVVQLQLPDCVYISTLADTCVVSLPLMPDAQESLKELDVHVQESFKEHDPIGHEQKPSSECEGTDQGMVALDGVLENIVLSVGQPGELQGKGGHAGVPTSIVLSNQRIAKQAWSSLAHLNSPGMEKILECGRLYASPEEATTWKLNAESHTRKRKRMESKIVEEKALTRFTEVVMAVKWKAQREAWKQKQSGSHSKMDYEKTLRVLPSDQRDGSRLIVQRSLLNPRSDTGSMIVDDNNEEVQIVQKLSNDFHLENERGFLRMPPMHLGKRERDLHKFETKNGLVEDPVSAEQERKAFNPWSMEEKKLFLDKYFLLGKDFRRIAAYLEHKTVADCVEFYYRNQKTEEFEKVHHRHQLKKRRDYQPSAPYLATTTSFSSRHREGNTASLEGLTLVAAAAAALSVPKEYPNFSPRVGIATAGVTKPFPRVLTAEGSNDERRGGKGARSTNTRPKACSEEIDLQWSDNEKKAYANAVVMFGRNFYSISQHVGTKTERQCKSFFSKARKGLRLDQLIERHKAILQSSMAENEIATPLIRDMKGKPATCTEGDRLQEQCMLERSSPPTVAPFERVKPDAPTDLPQGNCQFEDVMGISALKSMQEVGHAVLPERSVSKSVPRVNNAIKQEAFTLSDNGDRSFGDGDRGTRTAINCQMNGAPSVEPMQGCSLEESLVCGEILQFKTEPVRVKVEPTIGGNIANGVCNGTLSHIHTLCPPLVSALLPNSLPVAPVVQSAQVKDQSLKMETKVRREPTSWTQEEKDKFVDVLKVHGKNWDRLRENLPGKSLTQIKTYFQNSKAKLGFGAEGIVNGNGRVGSSRKKKADDSDSSSNAGSGGQNASQKAHMLADDGSLKVSPSMFIPPGAVGSHGLAAEALMYANLFSRNSLEESVNAQKVLHSIGLTPNTSTAGIHPLLNSAVFASPNLRASQQSYVHTNAAKAQQVVGLQQPQQAASPFVVVSPLQQPIVSMGIHQTHQLQQSSPPQPAVRMLQELALPAVQQLHKQPALLQSEVNQQALFQQQQQQVVQQLQQQVTEAVLQQQLSPQLLQRQLAQPVPHNFQQVLSQHQAHANQQASNQLPLGSSQSACSQLVSVSQPVTANQQLQQQPDLFQSQLYQMHTNSPALLQQHQQTQQLQLLQLHWQQQQAQAQQAQSKQVQNQLSQLQPQNFALLNEQQQQLAVFRGIMQVTSACTEALKQSDLDYSNFAKSHQGVCEDSHQPPVVSQVTQAPIKCQAVSDQLRAGDVKLFGQSLLSQPASSYQHQSGKVSSPSPQVAFSVPSSSFIASKSPANTVPQLPADALIRAPGWQQIAWPAAHFVSSGLSSVLASSNSSVGTQGADSEQHSVYEAVARMNERFIREAKSKEDGGSNEGTGSMALSSVLLDPANQPKRPESVVGSDHGIAVNKCREQDFSQTPSLAGGHAASQGLPRVLDALVALAEWRLQNVNGGSGRLTDEFLSQSWEALQRDPGSLVEASKAGGSLAQMCTGSGEMLQHLKDNLPSFSGSNGGVMWAGSSGQSHLSDAHNVLAQSSSLLRIHNGEAGILEVRDIDGRGGAAG